MHVASAAWVAVQDTEKVIVILMLSHEVSPLARACDLVGLLVVLASVIGISSLGRKRVIRHPFKVVGPLEISCCLEHLLKGIHHLHSGTKLRSAGRITEMNLLVSCPKSGRESEGLAHDLEGIIRCIQILRILRPLPPDYRFLEAVGKVHGMHRVLRAELVGLAPEHGSPRSRLAVDKVAEFKEELVTRDIVQPIDDVEIVTSPPLAPESPVVERFLGKVRELIFEVSCKHVNDTLVACRHVILLEDLKSDHLRPPVLCLASLETFNIFAGYPVSEVTVLIYHCQHGLRPDL